MFAAVASTLPAPLILRLPVNYCVDGTDKRFGAYLLGVCPDS